MTGLLDWLAALPAPLLYLAIGAAAFAENIFPPLPADTAVALGAFVAARGEGSAFGAWSATMVGNLGGAMLMYALGRRFGLPWLSRRMPSIMGEDKLAEFQQRYRRHGVWGIVVSRFLPGVRAIVPPVAGAFHIGLLRASLAMGVASGVWYGIVCWLAYRAGANADVLLATIARSQRSVGIVTAAIVLVAGAVWWWRRRRSRKERQ